MPELPLVAIRTRQSYFHRAAHALAAAVPCSRIRRGSLSERNGHEKRSEGGAHRRSLTASPCVSSPFSNHVSHAPSVRLSDLIPRHRVDIRPEHRETKVRGQVGGAEGVARTTAQSHRAQSRLRFRFQRNARTKVGGQAGSKPAKVPFSTECKD